MKVPCKPSILDSEVAADNSWLHVPSLIMHLDIEPSELASCWFLTGATASGKTRVGLELARELDAEIISLDSMAVYRGMNIGTAKPTLEQQAQVPHHLIDIRDPHEQFSVSEYLQEASRVIREIQSRGRQVLFVGGTPLYLKAMLRGIVTGPPADPAFRKQVQQEIEQVGIDALFERLAQVDPLSAAKLHRHDVRRIIRALEVYKLTGQPISHVQFQFDEPRRDVDFRVFVLDWPRSELHRRINRRVQNMFAEGLLDEVAGLLAQFGELGRTASQAVGYREVLRSLAGETTPEEALEQTQARTRQFAKRQLTWFRGLQECRWQAMTPDLTAVEVAREIAQQ